MSFGTPRVLACLALVVALLAAAGARGEEDPETKARELFAIGKYEQALAIYGKLWVATGHPTYQRNIGRCHQMMGEPDKAINAFREYLRRAPAIDPKSRHEVEGFIREMEALKREREARPAEPPGPPEEALAGGVVAKAPAEPPPATRSHAGQLGVFLRAEVGLPSDGGAVLVPGVSYGLGDHLELAAGALLGHYKGASLGLRALFLEGALKPGLGGGVPLFFVDGSPTPGIQAGPSLQWDPSRSFGVFLEMTVSFFPGVASDLREVWWVPVLGVQGRL